MGGFNVHQAYIDCYLGLSLFPNCETMGEYLPDGTSSSSSSGGSNTNSTFFQGSTGNGGGDINHPHNQNLRKKTGTITNYDKSRTLQLIKMHVGSPPSLGF